MAEERRVVTLLFSDVTGSTAMGESSDPEDVRAVLGRYYAIAREVIGGHGGTVEKFIGDAVMAVFGIPQAHGDDAERALAAALKLRDAVAQDPRTAGLALRIGVNTGEVVAAKRSDTADFLVTGDAVNVAARLQQHAEPGMILAGERTRRAAPGFSFGPERALEVKGKREPIAAAELLARIATGRPDLGPFVGREHDLAQLDLVARRAFAEKRPQLVTITAPAGTGKSRLVDEFAKRMNDTRIATAQCLPYGAAVTFLPLRGLVRDFLGTDEAGELQVRLLETFAAAGHPPQEAERLTALIAATLGDEASEERRDRDELFGAWRLLMETMAARGSSVVVFEDLHWASDTLLDLVEHMTTSRVAAPLVIFALARPELIDRKPQWGGGRRNFSSIALEPLNDEETRALVANVAAEAASGIARRIAERSGGNPFFAGELARAYRERRSEGKRDDDIVLPDTVHATVLARLDGLPAEERQVLELASVVGRTARTDAIHALAPAMDGAMRRALDSLAQRDLIVASGPDAYTFRHIVIREVAYATLPRAARVRVHLQLARWLEDNSAISSKERAELVAYHYRQAIALAPGGRVPEELALGSVLAALERAARAAWSLGAIIEAGDQLREAIRLAPAAEHLRLMELRGDMLMFGDDAIAMYRQAYQLWSAAGKRDPAIGARLLVRQLAIAGRWYGSLASPPARDDILAMQAEAARLLAAAPGAADDEFILAQAFQEVLLPNESARLAELLAATQRVVRAAQARGDADATSTALDALASLYRLGYGDYAKSLEASLERVAVAPRLSVLERSDAVAMAAWDLVFAGRYDEAVDRFEPARRLLRAGEPEFMMAHMPAWVALAAMLCGRWDDAIAVTDHLLALKDENPSLSIRFTYCGLVAGMRVASARMDSTRLARYKSAFTSIARPELLPEHMRGCWNVFIHDDAAAGRQYLIGPRTQSDRQAEVLMHLVFELDERIPDAQLDGILSHSRTDPSLLTLRVALARALNRGAEEIRAAIRALDEGRLVADAARAAALLAMRTRERADHEDAQRRLQALGDRAYLQKLRESNA